MYGDDDSDRLSLSDRFPWMKPVDQIPTLFRVLGTGLTMVGRGNFHDETSTYVSAHCLTVLFVPVLALGAYRVQDNPRGGWFFLGREPLRVLSWCGNALSVLLFLALIGAGVWFVRTGSSEYIDGNRLARAEGLIAQGRRAEAADLLGLILERKTSHAPAARGLLAELVTKPAGDGQDEEVYRVASAQDRRGEPVVPDLFKKGYQAADALTVKDPAAGLRLLEVVAPLALDPTEARQLERRLVGALAARHPGDVALASRLASLMSGAGEPNAELRAILVPHEGQFGTMDGAAILGGLYVEEGRYDRAVKLLRPYVEARLSAYLTAHAASEGAQKAVMERAGALIGSGTAQGFDHAKFRAAGEEEKRAMFAAYVIPLINEDVAVRVAGHALDRERLAVPAVLNLGLAELHLARAEADPAARRAGLEQAERTLLKIRDTADRSPAFRARLAQVYYWLGKPAEGRQLLDAMIADQKGSTEAINGVAQLLRSVGAVTEGRQLVEEAYNKEPAKEKKQALAQGRALLALDLDDRIVWLRRTGLDDVYMKASLASALGQKAALLGKEGEAAKHYREGIELYGGLAETPSTLNNVALCWFGLFDATYDIAAFREGLRRMEKAVALDPSNAILMLNFADALLTSAAAEVIGPAIDCKVVRRRPGLDLLGHLYQDAAGRAKVMQRLRAVPHFVQARATLERLTVVAPNNPAVFSQLAYVLELLDEGEGLKALAGRLEGQGLDTGDADRQSREFYQGEKDAQRRDESRAAVARAEKALEEARQVKGPTLAAAASRLAAQLLTLSHFEATDADRPVKLAEEGHAAAPSEATRAALFSARMNRAALALRKDPAFAEPARTGRRSLGSLLVQWALVGGGTPRERALALDDVKEAIRIKAEQAAAIPEARGPSAWALLEGNHPEAERIARRVLAGGGQAAKLAIDARVTPLGAVPAAEQAWLLRMEGKPAEARALLDDRAKKGVPLPVWGR